MKPLLLTLILLIGFSSSGLANDFRDLPPHYQSPVDRLIKDGFDKDYVFRIFIDSRTEPIPARLAVSLITREIPEIYTKFLSFEAILLAKPGRCPLTLPYKTNKWYQSYPDPLNITMIDSKNQLLSSRAHPLITGLSHPPF